MIPTDELRPPTSLVDVFPASPKETAGSNVVAAVAAVSRNTKRQTINT